MRDQYVGDVSDVLKFAFLRALARADRMLGIAWYYVPSDDGRADGRHLEWRYEPAWQGLDEHVCVGLSKLPERSVAALERARILPKGTLFHRTPMPSRLQRSAWGVQKRAALAEANIVFLDPDKGLGEETDATHATPSEVRLLRRPGRAIIIIIFPGRRPHGIILNSLHEQLKLEADAKNVITLRTNVSVPRAEGSRSYVPRQRWFTVVDPDEVLVARARAFANALASVPRVRATLECVE